MVISTGDTCCPPVAAAGSGSPRPAPAGATTSSTSFIQQKGSEVTERRKGRRRKQTGDPAMPTGTADCRFLLALTPPWALPAMEKQGAPPWTPSPVIPAGCAVSPSTFLFFSSLFPSPEAGVVGFFPCRFRWRWSSGRRDSQPFPRAWRPGIGAPRAPGRGQGLNWEEK